MLTRNPKVTLCLGMVALLVASLLNFAKHWIHGPAAEIWADGVVGFFYGVSITLMLMFVWRKAHPQR